MLIEKHALFQQLRPPTPSLSRHDQTQLRIKNQIAVFLSQRLGNGDGQARQLLEVGGHTGLQTKVYLDQLPAGSEATLCDWADMRNEAVKATVPFVRVDLEKERLPFDDASFDAVVCNQVLEHLKNIFTPLSEMVRVLRPGGFLLLSVPNLSALHNVALAAVGRQPSTLRLEGSHVRGYGIHSMTRFLASTGHLEVEQVDGVGLHPFTSATMPGPLKTWCHTPIWMCRRTDHQGPLWHERRAEQFTTTNFF